MVDVYYWAIPNCLKITYNFYKSPIEFIFFFIYNKKLFLLDNEVSKSIDY